MKKITLSILSIIFAMAAFGQPVNRSIRPKPGPAPEISLGKTRSFTLENGLKVFVVENHKLPTLDCNIQFDIDPALEGDMAGFRDMMSELLLAGTTSRSKDKLNEEIDNMGARISVSSEGIYASSLKKYQSKLFELMSDVAMNAVISQDELDLTKKKMLSGLETEKNEPDAMVRNVRAVVNFGRMHPYGEVPTQETVEKITLDRCKKYYKDYFRPNVAYMAIVGDITVEEVEPIIKKYFGKWQKATVQGTPYPTPASTPASKTKVSFAPRTAAVQSVINVTYPLPTLRHGQSDVVKAKVANTILGGGSSGRLFQNIREKHGWGYGSYSSIRQDDICGSFTATLKCKNNVTDSALEVLLNEMRIIRTEKVDDATLQNTINYMSGSFAISLEDPRQIAQFAINTERYHMPADYYRNYLRSLSAVTAEDVMSAAQKYILPDNANIIVAGSKEEVANKLARFSHDGKVDYYDYAGNPIKETEKKEIPLGLTADDVYKKYITAIGGQKAIAGLKDLKQVSTGEVQGMAITLTIQKKLGGKASMSIDGEMAGNKMTLQKQVFNGTTGYMEGQGQHIDMPSEQAAKMKKEGDLQLEIHDAQYGIKRKLTGIETVEGADAYAMEVTDADGGKSIEYYDIKSGFKVRETKYEQDPQGNNVPSTTDYSDYREVPGSGGYKLPYFMSIPAAGTALNLKVQSVEVNKGIPDSAFE